MPIRNLFLLASFFIAGHAYSLTADEAKAIATGEGDTRVEALNKALANGDDKTAAFVQALADEAVKVAGEKVIIVRDGKGQDPVTGAAVAVPEDAEDVTTNNRMRGEIDTALAVLKLFSKDDKVRGAAIDTLLSETDETKLTLIEKAFAAEAKPEFKERLQLVRAAILLGSTDAAKRLEAAKQLAQSNNRNTKTVVLERLKTETDPRVKAALTASSTYCLMMASSK